MSKLSDSIKRQQDFFEHARIYIADPDLQNIDTIKEWKYLLSIDEPGEVERVNELSQKEIKDISLEEMQEIIAYRQRHKLVELFDKYDKEECTVEEHQKVYDYMREHTLEAKLRELIGNEGFHEALNRAKEFDELPLEDRFNYVHAQTEVYESLSLVDRYALRVIASNANTQANKETNDRIQEETWERQSNLLKQLSKDGYL